MAYHTIPPPLSVASRSPTKTDCKSHSVCALLVTVGHCALIDVNAVVIVKRKNVIDIG